MNISFGIDHGAISLRNPILAYLKREGHSVTDHGTTSDQSVDYPDFAVPVCRDVAEGRSGLGVLCCTTGIGMSITANKVKGVRAALVHFEDSAQLTREHNHSNVICFDALHTTPYMAVRLLDVWLKSIPEGGRHERRVGKINAIETD